MWVLIEGTSFSGLLWANTLKSESLLCARSPTRLSSFWMCLQNSSDCVRRTARSVRCGTLVGGFPCLGARSCGPMADTRQAQLVPELAGPWGSLCFAPQVGTRVGSGCGGVLGQAGHPPTICSEGTGSACLNPPVIDLCRNQPRRGGFTRNALAWHQTDPSSPFLCLLLIRRDGKNKEDNRLATFRCLLTLVLRCKKNIKK